MMKKDNKNKELLERQAYVPAEMTVIHLTAQNIICQSNIDDGTIGDMDRESGIWD